MTTLTLIVVALQALNFWMYYKGRLFLSYVLTIAVYIGYAVVETWLAIRDPEQAAVVLFVLLDVWAVLMASLGLCRLLKVGHCGKE